MSPTVIIEVWMGHGTKIRQKLVGFQKYPLLYFRNVLHALCDVRYKKASCILFNSSCFCSFRTSSSNDFVFVWFDVHEIRSSCGSGFHTKQSLWYFIKTQRMAFLCVWHTYLLYIRLIKIICTTATRQRRNGRHL